IFMLKTFYPRLSKTFSDRLLGTLISGARRDYDLLANFCRRVSGGQLSPSQVIIHKQKELAR
ncbi:MAG: hypothetical protein ACXW6J_19275, partial [Candidatus Binatia bacterium]